MTFEKYTCLLKPQVSKMICYIHADIEKSHEWYFSFGFTKETFVSYYSKSLPASLSHRYNKILIGAARFWENFEWKFHQRLFSKSIRTYQMFSYFWSIRSENPNQTVRFEACVFFRSASVLFGKNVCSCVATGYIFVLEL